MAMFLSDLRSALRQLIRSPAVSFVAVLSLALGIGANTTVFTLVNALLLSPMPIRDMSRVVVIGTSEVRDGAPQFLAGTSRPNFVDLRDQQSVFSGDGAHRVHAAVALGQRRTRAALRADCLRQLLRGARPAAGRGPHVPARRRRAARRPPGGGAVTWAVAAPLRRRPRHRRHEPDLERPQLQRHRCHRRRLPRHLPGRRAGSCGCRSRCTARCSPDWAPRATTRGAASSIRGSAA